MENITLTINGQEIITTPGKTILQVVRENGLAEIPTLCHDDRLKPYGSCFLCVVEVAGLNRLLPACSSLATAGMIIETDNPRIRSARKTALELLLSNHYADCIGPCIDNCPAHVDAQGYIALISMGRHEEALKLVKQNNPLPLSIGRVCVRDCEAACRRQIVDSPVAINHLKRFIADLDAPHKWQPELDPPNNKTVGIVGGGPSGLTAAYYLTLKGYKVTVYEKLNELGGMLRYGIPEYRLPKKILDEEIAWILNLGVEAQTGVELGRHISIAGLRKKHDSLYLAVGAHRASTMRLEHEEDTAGVMKGIDFLRSLQTGAIPELKGVVAVVGGGNTAIDAARSALRCGADKVKIIYRRSIKEMPAHEEEIQAAQDEGVEMNFLTNPKSIIRAENKLTGVECLKMALKKMDNQSRPRPVPIPGSEFVMECDYLIGAIGQQVDTDFNSGDEACDLERWGTVRVNRDTLETSLPGVFAGGDVVTGPWTAIGSIAQGKMAANVIDHFLKTRKVIKPEKGFFSFKHKFHDVRKEELGFAEPGQRNRLPELPVNERIRDFSEVEQGYSEGTAEKETHRCLECGCSEYFDCKLRRYADEFGVNIDQFVGETREYEVDHSHPLIVNDPNKCISCGRCVRTCTDVLGVSALGFVHRGFRSVVRPELENTLRESPCIGCGNCVDNCPTGALAEAFPHKVLGTLAKEDMPTVCQFCSIGCPVNMKVLSPDHFHVANTTKAVQQGPNQGFLCTRGRFGHRFLVENPSVEVPHMREGDNYVTLDWDMALETVHAGIARVIKKHGADSVAVLVSPRWSNEAQYLAQKLGRRAIGTSRIGSFAFLDTPRALSGLNAQLGATISTASLSDLENADIIGVLPGAMGEESLVVETMIRSARNRGSRVVILGETGDRMAALADQRLTPVPGTASALFYALVRQWEKAGKTAAGEKVKNWDELHSLADGFDADTVIKTTGITRENLDNWLKTFADPERSVVWLAPPTEDDGPDAALPALVDAMLARGGFDRAGDGWILLDRHANAAGARELGIAPGHLPGFMLTQQKDDLKTAIAGGSVKALVVLGEDPLGAGVLEESLDKLEFLVAMDRTWTETLKRADVVLPAVSPAEEEGTMTRCDGVIQSLKPVVPVAAERWNWKVIARLGTCFGEGFVFDQTADVLAEIRTAHPMLSVKRDNAFRGASILARGPVNGGHFRFACTEVVAGKVDEVSDVMAAERWFKEKIRTE